MDEDEAALLAELRAISNQSAASRFGGGTANDNDNHYDESSSSPKEEEKKTGSPAPKPQVAQQTVTTSPEQKPVLVPEPLPTSTTEAIMGGGGDGNTSNFKQQASTFQGQRGGAAEDEELLAELRAISAKSSSANRFAEEEEQEEETTTTPPLVHEPEPSNSNEQLPPWKRGAAKPPAPNDVDFEVMVAVSSAPKKELDDVAVVAAPPPKEEEPHLPNNNNQVISMGGGGNFKQESNFSGERGGTAEDEELLAELRAISAKSSSSDRFAGGDDDDYSAPAPVAAAAAPPTKEPPRQTAARNTAVPPWKRGAAAKSQPQSSDIDVVVAAPPRKEPQVVIAAPPEPEPLPTTEAIMGGGGNFKQESTFQGERGGMAEDEELLAELRAISAKSSSTDRFAGGGDDDDNVSPPVAAPVPKNTSVPPWKRGKAAKAQSQSSNIDVVVAAPPRKEPQVIVAAPEPEPLATVAIMGGGGNFKQQSTFQGERGGMAEDEELLAELRAISAKSSSTNRFAGNEAEESAPVMEKPKPAPQKPASVVQKPNNSDSLPPWKRGQVKAPANDDVVVVVAAPQKVPEQEQEVAPPSGSGFQKSNTTNTFNGDRGGPAEDEDLLAELRAISAGASANRFVQGEDGPPPPKPAAPAPTPAFQKSSLPNTFKGDRGGPAEDDELLAELRAISAGGSANRFVENQDANPPDGSGFSSAASPAGAPPSTSNFPSSPMPAQEEQAPVVVTRDELPSSLKDNNWKVRKESYTVLRKIIVGAAGGKAPNGEIDADTVMPGLDGLILTVLMDKNANALDTALELALEYADYCRGAESSEHAERIVKALLKGSGFTSSRPSAAKVATALVLKLMEVGTGTDSVHSVTGVLLDLGITSKKPKVVALSASIILEAAYSFGAACLPLASVATALTKLLSHSNKKVRDTGMDLVAEFCRALGSKDPMNNVIEKMKKAQVGDLDKLLAKQPGPTPIKIGLRSQKSQQSGQPQASPEDALAALQAGSEALAAQRLAKRTAVDVLDAIRKTDYATRLKLPKWSEKAGALDTLLECGGEKPYKLVQPSHSANYTPLISEMRNTLSHTHFAVVGKAMQVLAMLADGVGEKLFPNLRPLLPKLFALSKDKKLTKFLAACLDSFFGNVLAFEHILDSDSALPDALDERMEKNALARTTSLEYLGRCVTRGESAGLRGKLTHRGAQSCAELCVGKLDDSDAKVRKAALDALKSLQAIDDPELAGAVGPSIEGLQTSNPRAYKSLSTGAKKSAAASKAGRPPAAAKAGPGKSSAAPPEPKKEPSRSAAATPSRPTRPAAATPMRSAATPPSRAAAVPSQSDSGSGVAPSLDEAIVRCESLDIPQWGAADEDGGILAGLETTKWLFRQSAIKGLAAFVSAREILDSPSDIETDSVCMLTFVKEHTRGFKETNVNVLQSIMELFLALCDYHERANQPFPLWATKDGITIATEKIADKKLSAISKTLLMGFCEVQFPHFVLANAVGVIHKVKAPAAHEEMLKWFKLFCNEFGAASIGKGVNDTVTWLLQESKATNVKIKKAAMAAFGTLHVQLGPAFQAVALSTVKEQSLRDNIEGAFRDHPYDPTASSAEWPKHSIMLRRENADSNGGGGGSALLLDVPKTDLIAALSDDCVSRMGSKDGKTAWKQRKAAMDEVEDVMKRSSGMLDASKMKSMVELLRALRDRLSDSQSNLKPVAARIIGSILGAVDKEAQAKLGKVVYAPLINCAMNDSKKNMHDAAIESLRAGTSMAPLEGDGPNELALESFVIALSGELTESELKAGGISDVLSLTNSFCASFPNLDNVTVQRGESLGEKFARALVDCLTSSKADIRAAAESLLQECVKNGVLSLESAKKSAFRLKPAQQRSVGPILAKFSAADSTSGKKDASTSDASNEKAPSVASSTPVQKQRTSIFQRRNTGGNQAQPVVREKETAKKPAGDDHHVRLSAVSHPLIAESGSAGVQASRSAQRSMTWPDYPEEPTGSSLFASLKKAWHPLIPAESLQVLFPDRGVRKQDDAKGGCELLSRAIVMERSGEGYAIVEQLGLILKWTVYVLCSKESPVGLQALLVLLGELVDYLRMSKYVLSDSEALHLVPFLFEKAGAAKGRFKDTYTDLIDQVKTEDLVPSKVLGPLVCVSLIESSSNAKARVMACKECCACVESLGLSGIGKKGVLVAAKSLSEEKLPENRTALLDLMELILPRMNGDMQRFVRICGPNLSDKARVLIEERLKKGTANDAASTASAGMSRSGIPGPPKSFETSSSSRRISARIPNPAKSPTPAKVSTSRMRANPKPQGNDGDFSENQSSFSDELPALDFRTESRDTPIGIPRPGTNVTSVRPINFSLDDNSGLGSTPTSPQSKMAAPKSHLGGSVISRNRSSSFGSDVQDTERPPSAVGSPIRVEEEDEHGSVASQSSSIPPSAESLGAAASLRARLLKIREKNKTGPTDADANEAVDSTTAVDPPKSSAVMAKHTTQFVSAQVNESLPDPRIVNTSANAIGSAGVGGSSDAKDSEFGSSVEDAGEEFSKAMDRIQLLLEKPTPLEEDDSDIIACTDALKTIHAAVSRQPNLAVGMNEEAVLKLRDVLASNSQETVAGLTRLIDFGFSCHHASLSAGMSVPLLSVNLACLMALFRSDDLASTLLQGEVTALIKEAGKALLDPRLASSSSSVDPSRLDEATSTQMVRAINKLAVQAATGATRHVSLISLMSLQLDLGFDTDGDANAVFNSRLSRVVTKLFARVVKAEEGTPIPFSSSVMDTEAVLCCLEDTLVACDDAEREGRYEDGVAASRNLVKVLIVAMLKARGGPTSILSELDELGINPDSSSLGNLVKSYAEELNFPAASSPRTAHREHPDVATLVAAVGSSLEGPERDAAVSALRSHKETYGDDQLNAHLNDVSAAFRAFILEQLSDNPAKPGGDTSKASSMSERIKNLRSKLNSSEAFAQSAVEAADNKEPVKSVQDSSHAPRPPRTGLQQPSPPKLPTTTSAEPQPGVASVRAFRERLAFAQGKRTTVGDETEVVQPTVAVAGRAAALRARLQAVKNQSELEF